MAARGRARVRDRLRGARLSRRRRDHAARSSASSRCCASGRRRPSSTCRRRGRGRRSATRSSQRRGSGCSTSRAAARARTRSSARGRVFYEGFVAEEIDALLARERRAPDRRRPRASGTRRSRSRRPSTTAGSPCARPGRGARARSACSSSRSSSGFDVADMSEEELVHVVTECAKLAFADRDALYGDAQPVPLDTLLSADVQRRAPRARRRRRRRRSCGPAWAASRRHHTPG